MLNSLNSFIQNHQLFNKTDKIGIAISGGKDSVALAHMLNELEYTFDFVHCNFMLRKEESNEDEKFIVDLAKSLPFCENIHIKRFDTLEYATQHKVNTQIAARQLRYDYFADLFQNKQITKLLTAHHKTDLIETFFINLLRGSGLKGLKSIPVKRDFIVRPFLAFHSAEILQYIKVNSINFREDSSNKANKYLRNKFRNIVLPNIREHLPELDNAVVKSAAILDEQSRLLNHFLDDVKNKICEIDKYGDIVSISISELCTYPQNSVVLYHLLDKYGFNYSQCQQILAAAETGNGQVFTSSKFQLLIHQDKFLIQSQFESFMQEIEITGEGIYVFNNATLTVKKVQEAIFNQNSKEEVVSINEDMFPLTLRYWQNGDYFNPLGMEGKKLMSDFFVDAKISVFEKHSIPLLCKKENVLWVCGKRISNTIKAQKNYNLYRLNIIFET